EVIMPVEHYNAVKLGMRADIRPLVPGAGVHSATVTAVDPVVDAASNTFGVRLELPNVDRSVPGGIRCDVSFKRD
ncbi:MAG: efflux RND transporter periplasmic adaptor subunit, partial [Gammaproteobacteria bacterium]|nr:efflux RND transporter periplasmic adaptor subunit [Gammaproteobacteria bacterium]